MFSNNVYPPVSDTPVAVPLSLLAMVTFELGHHLGDTIDMRPEEEKNMSNMYILSFSSSQNLAWLHDICRHHVVEVLNGI